MRIYSPSPSVQASRVPLYLRGGRRTLGQYENASWADEGDWYFPDTGGDASGFDFTDVSPIVPEPVAPTELAPPEFAPPDFPSAPGDFVSFDPELQPLIDQGFSRDEADIIAQAVSSGLLSDSDWNAIMNHEIDPNDLQAFIFGGSAGVLPPVATTGRKQSGAAGSAAGGGAMPSGSAGAKAGGGATQKAQLPPGPSPRVAAGQPGQAAGKAVSVLDQEWIPGLKNRYLALLAGGALLLPSILPAASPAPSRRR